MRLYKFPSKPVASPGAVVGGKDLPYRFTVLADGLVRYEYASDHVFEDRASTFAVFREQPVPSFRVIDKNNQLEIITECFHLYYDKQPFSSNGLRVQVIGNITDASSTWRYGYKHELEIYELGGTARTLDRADGRIPLGPAVIGRNGYGEIDDSDSMLFTHDGWIAGRLPSKESPRVDGYLFAYGLDFKSAIKAFYKISGPQPLIPRWALGNWWSRYYKYTSEAYLELMDRFKEEKIPFSVGVLDMDWHWVEDERVRKAGMSGWTGYSWDTGLIPNPQKLLKELHERKLKVPVNDHPADGIASYEDKYEEVCRAVGQYPKPKDPVPFNITSKAYVEAYFDIVIRKLEDDGVDFIWQDWQQGSFSSVSGIDPLWPLNHFHFLNSARDDKRPFIFSRFAGPGSHRYPIGFSGDAVVTWESLEFQPEFTASASNIGFGWWSNDIGGHMHGYRNDELATRWVQLGTFSPIMRLHSTNNPWMSKEPWNYPPEACAAQIEILRFRHRLIPYLYTCNVLSARDDVPLIRPIYWSHPTRAESYIHRNTFNFGPSLLVIPSTRPRNSVTKRSQSSAWLPPSSGGYVDIFSGVVYSGDRTLLLHRKLNEIAVLAPAGSIIPLDGSSTPEFGTDNPNSLEVLVVPGANGTFDLWEDDGSGSGVDSARLTSTRISYNHAEGTFFIQSPATQPFLKRYDLPTHRQFTVSFIGVGNCELGAKLRVTDSDEISNDVPYTIAYDPYRRKQSITIQSFPTDFRFALEFEHPPTLAPNTTPSLCRAIINDAQIPYDTKKTLWNAVSGEGVEKNGVVSGSGSDEARSTGVVAAEVAAICRTDGLDAAVGEALGEVIGADGGVRGVGSW